MENDESAGFSSKPHPIQENDQNKPAVYKTGRATRALLSALLEDISKVCRYAREWIFERADKSRLWVKRLSTIRPIDTIDLPAARVARTFTAMRGWRPRLSFASFSRLHFGLLRSWKATICFSFCTALIIVAGVLTWALQDVPWDKIANGSTRPGVVLEMADGSPMVTQGAYQGAYAEYKDFPPQLINAVLSIEDRRFMDHYGIDFRGIGRAFVRNFQAGAVVQGGSTITQQMIKVQYLDNDRTVKRKIQEVVLSFWLEWKLGKQEILARYLNSVYLGAGATGMPAAAHIYFNKDLASLDLQESALLAGLLKAPSQYNPISNIEGARARTATVLNAMADNGKLDKSAAEKAIAGLAELHSTTSSPRLGSWFADWVSGQANGIADTSSKSITVRTTLVPRYQQIAEKVIRRALEEDGKAVGASQAALVAMTADGAVVAMVGGVDYGKSQFNRAATAMRQPGSTFKLFVYYAALKQGFSLQDRVRDGPVEIDGWRPQNSGEGYQGWVTLAEAFARSLNAATAVLGQEVGIDHVIDAARELGIDALLKNSPSLVLGTSEVSLLDLTGAYASVSLGKAPVQPWGIRDYKSSIQKEAYRVGPIIKPTVDISTFQPDLVTLLQLVVEHGTGHAASGDFFAAGKTGTSQDNRDAWFVGFTEPLVAGVWVGNDDNSPMKGVTGGALPARIWKEFMREAMAEQILQTDDQPANVSTSNQSIAPSCNLSACSRKYRSFQASDCSYQPYSGARRMCEM